MFERNKGKISSKKKKKKDANNGVVVAMGGVAKAGRPATAVGEVGKESDVRVARVRGAINKGDCTCGASAGNGNRLSDDTTVALSEGTGRGPPCAVKNPPTAFDAVVTGRISVK